MPGGTGKKTDGSGGRLTGPEPYTLWNPPNALVICGTAYPIRTDFRTAVRYAMAAMDGSLTAELFYRLWFPGERPEDLTEAMEAVGAFYNMGQAQGDGADGPIPYSFSADAGPIYAAFQKHYGIDLAQSAMHWWRFRALLEGPITHSFRQRALYRTADLRGRDAEERAEILKYRALYAIGGEGEDLRSHLRRLEEISRQYTEGK